jgi:sugar phosphate isomerase/epimerase
MLSCVPVSYFQQIRCGKVSFEEVARIFEEVGLKNVDLSVALLRRRDERYLESVRRAFLERGIKIACLVTYSDFLKADAYGREEEAMLFGRDVETAKCLGAEFIRITAGPENAGIARKEGIDWVVEGILKSERYGREFGVKILYENHAKPSVWERPDFSLPTEVFLTVCERIRGSEIRILFDTANPLVFGDDPCTVLNEVIDRVAYLHLSDIKSKGHQQAIVLGRGIVPFERIFHILEKAEYHGPISMEEASNTGKRGLTQALAFTGNLIERYGYVGSTVAGEAEKESRGLLRGEDGS